MPSRYIQRKDIPFRHQEKKGYKIDYKSFSVVKNCKNLIDGENLKEKKRTKNCVHRLLHERTDVKNSLKNTREGVQH